MGNFKPCGCGWISDKEYIECPDHTSMREHTTKKLEKAFETIDYLTDVNSELRNHLESKTCPKCSKYDNTKFPVTLSFRDLEITIDKKGE